MHKYMHKAALSLTYQANESMLTLSYEVYAQSGINFCWIT